MHYDRLVFMILLALGSCRFGGNQNPGQQGRTSIDFDKGWKFSLGNFASANNPDFDDKDWRILNVPHDWSIEGDYEADNPSGMAGAFLPTGIGWYRKVFSWEPEWQDKKIFIEFDGIYMNSTVWLNGKELGNRPYGYIGFSYELTPYLRKGENVLAVKGVHSKNPSGRW